MPLVGKLLATNDTFVAGKTHALINESIHVKRPRDIRK